MASGINTGCLINGVQYKCRTCFDPGRTIYPLTNEASNSKTWFDLLMDIAHLQANDDELLPKTLCCKCSEKLKRSYDFVMQIQNVNKKYAELLTKELVSNEVDNFTDCLAESAIALPLGQYMSEIKIEEEIVSYDVDNKFQEQSQAKFCNEDNDDPFTETFNEDIKSTSVIVGENESAIAITGESSTKRKRRKQTICRKPVKGKKKVIQPKDIEKSSQTDETENTDDDDDDDDDDDNDEKKPIVCGKCTQTFFTIYKYQRHQQKEHYSATDEDRNKCPICSKQFRNKFSVVDHIKVVHDKLKPFKCSHCVKRFPSACAKRTHELSHTDDFPYKCEFCNRRFRLPGKLKVHLEIHTTRPELLCPICKRSQKSVEDLEAHVKNHDDNRLQCPSCGHLFRKRSNLTEHYNAVHLKLRPYKCEFCDGCFGDRKSRRVHERSHTKKNSCKKDIKEKLPSALQLT